MRYYRSTLIHTDTKLQIRDGSKWYALELSETRYEKIAFIAEAERQIQVYEMAIKALESGETEGFMDRCYLGSPCPYQMPV